jgi:hypothetical protein
MSISSFQKKLLASITLSVFIHSVLPIGAVMASIANVPVQATYSTTTITNQDVVSTISATAGAITVANNG